MTDETVTADVITPAQTDRLTFSLVLCTLGRTKEVEAFCESLLRQKRNNYELIIVDQNADGRLDEIAKRYASKLPLRHVRSAVRGASRARNEGIDLAKGDIVGFPDDDCEYYDAFLDRVAELFEAHSDMDGLTGCPSADRTRSLPDGIDTESVMLSRLNVLNRCQEFTIFVRRQTMGSIRFNAELGVGAGTPWGAEEAPDFLIRLIEVRSAHVRFFPRLVVYHPNKIGTVTLETLRRAASYACGRGCLFRLHSFPIATIAHSLLRSSGGAVVYALCVRPQRARYYLAVFTGTVRGLLISGTDLRRLRGATD